MTFPALSDVLATCREQRITSFSFDIFDTFLFRRCTTPDGVFDSAYDFAPLEGLAPGWRDTFRARRREAEFSARATLSDQSKGKEVTIEQIYQRFPVAPFGLNDTHRPALVEAEFQAEKVLCFVNDQALALYRALRDEGIKTGFISDIYWSQEQISALLRHCQPDLEWDFLYTSSAYGKGKSQGLLRHSLRDRGIKAEQAAHIGDNPAADITPAQSLGITAFYCPQMRPALAGIFQREQHLHQTLCSHLGSPARLDHGLRTLRRRIAHQAAQSPDSTPARRYGSLFLGPLLSAFHRFLSDRIASLRASPAPDDTVRRVGIAFLARDGLLPQQVWQAHGHHEGAYIAVNRRTALVASASDLDDIAALFDGAPMVNTEAVEEFFKTSLPKVARYFAKQPGGAVKGATFALALDKLLSPKDIKAIADAARQRMMTHLRRQIPDLDQLSDLVLVDVGYSGTVQKGLRKVLDAEGLSIRLHGAYVIINDEAFYALTGGDSAQGLISDHSMMPHGNAALRRNVSVLEQMFSEPVGSVNDYTPDGGLEREDDPRPAAHHALFAEIRQGALEAIAQTNTLIQAGWPDPFADWRCTAPAIGAILARILLLPTDDELALFSGIGQDVNLGSQAMVPLLDTAAASVAKQAMPLTTAIQKLENSLWPAASFGAVSPTDGYLYAMFAADALPSDIFADAKAADLPLILVRGQVPAMVKAACWATSQGSLRLQMALPSNSKDLSVLLPLADLPPYALIRGISLQQGLSARTALRDSAPTPIPLSRLTAQGAVLAAPLYQRQQAEAHILIPLPPTGPTVHILNITLEPLNSGRLMTFDPAA
jgi:FMN phosphatase YigB (HAD superfamily)